MTKREHWWVVGLLLTLCALSALGVLAVLQKQTPASVAAFADRFVPLDTLGFAANEGLTCAVEPSKLTLNWPQGGATPLLAQSGVLPLTRKSDRLQADISIGGTQNADGAQRFGYRVWLSVTLYRQGEPLNAERIEIPLESQKARARLYSLSVAYGDAAPDGYALQIQVEPLDGAIAPGTLTCAWLEVFP